MFLLPFGLSAEIAATDAAIQKKIYGSGTKESIISNDEMEDISETIKNEARKKKEDFSEFH